MYYFFGTGPNLFWTYRKTGHYLHIKTNIGSWIYLRILNSTALYCGGYSGDDGGVTAQVFAWKRGDIIPDNLVKLFVWIRSSIPTNFESISPILGIRLKALRLISIPAICIEVIMFIEFFADSLKPSSIYSWSIGHILEHSSVWAV